MGPRPSARLEPEVASFAEDVPPGTAIQNVRREGLLFPGRFDHRVAFRSRPTTSSVRTSPVWSW